MHNSMTLFAFLIFDRKYPFYANLVQKNNIISLSWNLLPMLIPVCRIQWWRWLFLIKLEILFLGKFGPKNEDYEFKLKFGTHNNSNMQNSMAMFTLSVINQQYPFCTNLLQKVQIVSLDWNLVPSLILICRIQWCV